MAVAKHRNLLAGKNEELVNYSEALAYIYSFSDFERGSSFTRDRNENQLREKALLELLGNPHQHYSTTLVAGTKGKGSITPWPDIA